MSEPKYNIGDKFILEITDIDQEAITQGYPKPAYLVQGMNGAFSENVLDKLERVEVPVAAVSSKIIEKKIIPKYFTEVQAGRKNFELRKDEDDIQVGDTLILKEFNPADGSSTGRSVKRTVTYVLRNVPEYGLQEGYCIIVF